MTAPVPQAYTVTAAMRRIDDGQAERIYSLVKTELGYGSGQLLLNLFAAARGAVRAEDAWKAHDPHSEPDDVVTGHITGPGGERLDYVIAEEYGEIFAADVDYQGLTLTLQLTSRAQGQAIAAHLDATGRAGLWPIPHPEDVA